MKDKLTSMTLEELWQLFPIELKPHDKRYALVFGRESEEIRKILLPLCTVTLTHIGSTAIPGIYAKPIVDILAEIRESTDMEKVAEMLENNGWRVMSRDGKRISLNKGYTESGFADEVFHLHLRYAGDNDEIFFRDYLRSHPEIADEYEKLKLELGKKYRFNRDAYTQAKTGFVKKYTNLAKQKEENIG